MPLVTFDLGGLFETLDNWPFTLAPQLLSAVCQWLLPGAKCPADGGGGCPGRLFLGSALVHIAVGDLPLAHFPWCDYQPHQGPPETPTVVRREVRRGLLISIPASTMAQWPPEGSRVNPLDCAGSPAYSWTCCCCWAVSASAPPRGAPHLPAFWRCGQLVIHTYCFPGFRE